MTNHLTGERVHGAFADRRLSIRKGQLMPWHNISGPHEIDDEKMWSIARAMERGEDFPPVRVVKYDGYYHIIDGHHRVAAVKKLSYPLSALIADGEQFEDLDNELRASGEGRADDERFWL